MENPYKQGFLFHCKSVAISRGSTATLSTLRHSWQQQPSANTKRGKPQCVAPRPGCGMNHHSWHACL